MCRDLCKRESDWETWSATPRCVDSFWAQYACFCSWNWHWTIPMNQQNCFRIMVAFHPWTVYGNICAMSCTFHSNNALTFYNFPTVTVTWLSVLVCACVCMHVLASFPGLPTVQFFYLHFCILQVIKNWTCSGKAWERGYMFAWCVLSWSECFNHHNVMLLILPHFKWWGFNAQWY